MTLISFLWLWFGYNDFAVIDFDSNDFDSIVWLLFDIILDFPRT